MKAAWLANWCYEQPFLRPELLQTA